LPVSFGLIEEYAYILVWLLLVIFLVTVVVLLILIVLVFEVVLIEVFEALLELQSLTSEPVDGTGNELLLDVLTELVVELELGLNVVLDLLVVLGRGAGGVEEVEEWGSGDGLLDNAGLLGVWRRWLVSVIEGLGKIANSLLLRCFLLSTLTVRSLPDCQSILSPSAWS
jgi:hypothetical protein